VRTIAIAFIMPPHSTWHSESRCFRIGDIEKQYIAGTILQDGEMQAARDAALRANYAAGRDVFDTPGSVPEKLLNETLMV
jgi:hypothetical protein